MDDEYNLEAVTIALQSGDREAALRLILPHAEAGNSDAQCEMALLSPDFEEAERWLLKAAEAGQPSRLE
jgi:hypothetical protein